MTSLALLFSSSPSLHYMPFVPSEGTTMAELVSAQPYVYNEIPPSHINLLKITAVDPRIVCSIESYTLDNAPAFHAISYAWGDENVEHTAILCDGKELMVTPHLHKGLRCLTISTRAECLWVDAICIDQQNHHEKAQQVRHMHIIYKVAAEVFICLGAADETSDRTIHIISLLLKVVAAFSDHLDSYHEVFARYELVPPNENVWSAIRDLCNRTWTQRLWVVQEVALAKQLSVFCGLANMKWDPFARFCDLLLRFYTAFRLARAHDSPYDLIRKGRYVGMRGIVALEYLRRQRSLGRSKVDLLLATQIGRLRMCKNAVDHLYGFLGFAEDTHDIFYQGILVDYSSEAVTCYWKVFTSFDKISIMSGPGLKLLEHVGVTREERPEGLPS